MSSMSSSANPPIDKQLQRRGRIMGAAIMAVIFLPMAIAYGVYHTGIGMPTHTVNRGDLLTTPQNVRDLSLRNIDDSPWTPADQKKKWRWLIPGDAHCDDACQQNLYLTRQVHIRLAEKAGRVERIYLLQAETLDAGTADFLTHEHPHMPVLKVDRERLQALLNAGGQPDALRENRYLLMDQDGFIMMSYTPTHTGQQLLDDIKRLLKFSYED